MRVLLIGSGAPGGIGRFERSLAQALTALRDRGTLEVETMWRDRHPEYLDTSSPGVDGAPAGSPALGAFLGRVTGAVLRQRPDVLVTTTVNLGRLALPFRRVRPSMRSVVQVHGVEVWEPLDGLKRTTLSRADRIVTHSTFSRDRVCQAQGVPGDRVTVISLPAERTIVERAAGAEDGRTNDGPRLLSVTRLDHHEQYKRVDVVIEALARLGPDAPRLTYDVVGDGSDLPRLKALARDRGVADRVRFHGLLDHDELMRAYAACDVFVLPSTGEGFGLVFLEAMAFAKPVIAAPTGGPLDIVIEGETGHFAQTPGEVAAVIARLVADPDRAAEMGRAGRRRVQTDFGFDTYSELWRELLSTVVAPRDR